MLRRLLLPKKSAVAKGVRHFSIGFQGSGNTRDAQSLTRDLTEWDPQGGIVVDGPGNVDVLGEGEMPFGSWVPGLRQTPQALARRLDVADRALIEYVTSGGKGPIYVFGHSRGGGVAYAFCVRLNIQGLVDPVTGGKVLDPGVPIDGLVTLDPVPHTPGKGYTLIPTGDSSRPFRQARYDEMPLPENVKRSIVVLAGAERRDEFTPAFIGLGDKRTSMVVVPQARHADVDDWREGNRRAGRLSRHVVSSQLGADHLKDGILSDEELRQLAKELAGYGVRPPIVNERLVEAIKGASTRRFPLGIRTAASTTSANSAGRSGRGLSGAEPVSPINPQKLSHIGGSLAGDQSEELPNASDPVTPSLRPSSFRNAAGLGDPPRF